MQRAIRLGPARDPILAALGERKQTTVPRPCPRARGRFGAAGVADKGVVRRAARQRATCIIQNDDRTADGWLAEGPANYATQPPRFFRVRSCQREAVSVLGEACASGQAAAAGRSRERGAPPLRCSPQPPTTLRDPPIQLGATHPGRALDSDDPHDLLATPARPPDDVRPSDKENSRRSATQIQSVVAERGHPRGPCWT